MILLNTEERRWTAVKQRNTKQPITPVQATQHNTNIHTLSVHNAVVHSKSIQVQSCKGNTTGPKGRDAAAESRGIEKQSQSLIRSAGRKWNGGIGSDKVGGALQSETRQVIKGENYLLLGVWFKRCIVRHHPLQHSWRLGQRRRAAPDQVRIAMNKQRISISRIPTTLSLQTLRKRNKLIPSTASLLLFR